MKQITLIILLLISIFASSQTIVKVHEINFIGKNDSEKLNFYEKNKNNEFNVIYVDEDEYSNDQGVKKIEANFESGEIKRKEDILKENIIIANEDLLTFDFKKYFKIKKYEVIKENQKKVFSFLNEQIIMVSDYEYEEVYDPKVEKNITDWNYSKTEFYGYFYLEIKGGKKIIILSDNKGYIIPAKNKILINIDKTDFSDSKPCEINPKDLKLYLKYFRTESYYHIKKEVNHKFTLRDDYDTPVFKTKYDSIFFNDKFVVTRLKNNFEIYNIQLEKFKLKNIRAVYEQKSLLQVLQKNEVKTINSLNSDEKIKEDPITVCGTVENYSFEINNSVITYIIDKSFTSTNQEKKIVIGDLSKLQLNTIKFLNNTNKLEYDDNSFYSNPHLESMYNWLIVSKNNKYGLLKFIESENRITFEEVLPIEYDEILSTGNSYYFPLKLKKDNLYTYYKVNNKKYKKLEKFIYNFCRFELVNGKKGWLDIKGKEYYDQE